MSDYKGSGVLLWAVLSAVRGYRLAALTPVPACVAPSIVRRYKRSTACVWKAGGGQTRHSQDRSPAVKVSISVYEADTCGRLDQSSLGMLTIC